jgi:hypothetical protein
MPLPDGSWGDTATGSIPITQDLLIGAVGGSISNRATRFKVAKTITVAAVWIKVGKTGNPTDNTVLKLYGDSGSLPDTLVANGTSATIAVTFLTAAGAGAWYRYTFSTPYPTINADTYYWADYERSGAGHASNYYRVKACSPSVMPQSRVANWDGTEWSDVGDYSFCFMIEPTPDCQFLQTGGQFDCQIVGNSNPLPINQADYLWRKLEDGSGWFDGQEGTILLRGSAWTKDRTIFDAMYGLNHDRLVLRCNDTTGYAQLDVYDSTGTKLTVTGTSDISSGFHDVAIIYRFKGDGSDYLYLIVDGASQGTSLTSQTISMDKNFKENGSAWLLGGFGLAPAMTQTLDMSVLPSAAVPAWSYQGTAPEAAHFAVNGGKGYQLIVGSSDTVYYKSPDPIGFSNSDGYTIIEKVRLGESNEMTTIEDRVWKIFDGTYAAWVHFYSYYLETTKLSKNYKVQIDFRSTERVVMVSVLGTSIMILVDGLIVAGGELTTSAGGSNFMYWGDTTIENAESITDYLAYYNTAAILPEFTGGSLSEFATWSGDRSALLPLLWNSGASISVREYCVVPGNYSRRVLRKVYREGITLSPDTLSQSPVVLPDMECFIFSDSFRASALSQFYNVSLYGKTFGAVAIDGIVNLVHGLRDGFLTERGETQNSNVVPQEKLFSGNFGLHKIESRWWVEATRGVSPQKSRKLIVQEV